MRRHAARTALDSILDNFCCNVGESGNGNDDTSAVAHAAAAAELRYSKSCPKSQHRSPFKKSSTKTQPTLNMSMAGVILSGIIIAAATVVVLSVGKLLAAAPGVGVLLDDDDDDVLPVVVGANRDCRPVVVFGTKRSGAR